MNNILSLTEASPQEVAKQIAARVKTRRLNLDLTQEGLAVRAGLKLPTYRRFERTGEISLKGLLQIAFALHALQDFEQVFSQTQYQSLDELINRKHQQHKRGKKNV